MALYALGLNHQTAPLALRERLAFAPEAQEQALVSLARLPGVEEAALLSTCNRTEIYLGGDAAAAAALPEWLAGQHALPRAELEGYLYRHDDADAARHLFRVATGLDSLVLGEPQILGQVKEAYQRARGAGTLRPALERLFQHSFAVAKRVRTDTRIGAHPVSVAYAAVRLARQVFADLERATVLLVGAGETIELAARHLVDARAQRVLVANRTLEHAQELASRCGGYALPLSELDRHLPEADIVLSATASRLPVVTRAQVERALSARRHRPMFMLDLAVPRDIEDTVAALEDVYLYTVDDLEQVIEESRRFRQQAAEQAEVLIDLQVGHFMAWWRGSFRQDALRQLRRAGEATRDTVLERAARMLEQGRDPADALRFLAHTLTNKLLHAPSAALREAAMRGDAELLRAAERLYQGMDRDDDDSGAAPKA